MINILSNNKSADFPPVRVVYDDEDVAAILSLTAETLRSGVLTQGPLVDEFELEISRWVDDAASVAVNSATSGLEIILRALNVAGKEVIIPANTFVATAAAALHAGATVKFVDIELGSYSIDPEALLKKVSPGTAAVVVVHIGGIISERIEEIRQICADNSLFLIEDSAQALGSYYKKRSAGTIGAAGAFSFFGTKIISTGEGGMIITKDKDLKAKALILRNHGKDSDEECVALGYNWRMSEINAALGLVQLKKLQKFLTVKKRVAQFYDEALAEITDVKITEVSSHNDLNYYKYILLLEENISKQKIRSGLKDDFGVSLSGDVFPRPCSSLTIFNVEDEYPVAEDFCKRHICLPIYANMNLTEAKYVVKAIKAGLSRQRRRYFSLWG